MFNKALMLGSAVIVSHMVCVVANSATGPLVAPADIAAGIHFNNFSLSYDGRWFFFSAGAGESAYMDLTTGKVVDIDTAGFSPGPDAAWSPVVSQLSYMHWHEGRYGLRVWEPGTNKDRMVIPQLPRRLYPMDPVIWSPDGKTIYFYINQDLPWDKKDPKEDKPVNVSNNTVTHPAGSYRNSVWEHVIDYEKEYPNAWGASTRTYFMAVDVASGKLGLLAKGNDMAGAVYLSPDGRRLIAAQIDVKLGGKLKSAQTYADIYVMDVVPVGDLSAIDLEHINDRKLGWSDHAGRQLKPVLTGVQVDLPGGSYNPGAGGGDYGKSGYPVIVWSPKSDAFAYAAAGEGEGDIYLYNIASKENRNLTVGIKLPPATKSLGFSNLARSLGRYKFSETLPPLWLPDGQSLVVVAEGEIWQIPVDPKEKLRKLTDSVAEEAIRIIASPGLRTVALDGEGRITILTKNRDSRYDTVWKLSVETGAATRLSDTGIWTRDTLSTDEQGKYLVYKGMTTESGQNAWRVDLGGPYEPKRLTSFKMDIAEQRFPVVRILSWKTPLGLSHGLLYLPNDADPGKKLPMVLLAEYDHDLADAPRVDVRASQGPVFYRQSIADLLEDGIAVFMPDAPMSEYGKYAYPMNEISNGVDSALDAVLGTGLIDEKRIGMTGYSIDQYGGYRVHAVLTKSDRFKVAVSVNGATDWFDEYGRAGPEARWRLRNGQTRFEEGFFQDPARYVENSPAIYWDRVKTPLLLINEGAQPTDQYGSVPLNRAFKIYNTALETNQPMILAQYPRMSGYLTLEGQRRIRFWYREHLLGGEPITHIADQGSFIFTNRNVN